MEASSRADDASMTSDAEKIARGGQPEPWSLTITHRRHGELTFRAAMPTALDLVEHYVRVDNYLATLTSEPRVATMVLAAAIAGLAHTDEDPAGRSCLIDLPVVDELREPDDERGSEKITRLYYDAASEPDVEFLTEVWTRFSLWRNGVLEEVDAVKGSSGTTAGSGSKQPSDVPTTSPSTTRA